MSVEDPEELVDLVYTFVELLYYPIFTYLVSIGKDS